MTTLTIIAIALAVITILAIAILITRSTAVTPADGGGGTRLLTEARAPKLLPAASVGTIVQAFLDGRDLMRVRTQVHGAVADALRKQGFVLHMDGDGDGTVHIGVLSRPGGFTDEALQAARLAAESVVEHQVNWDLVDVESSAALGGLGIYNRDEGRILIRPGLSPTVRQYVLVHEHLHHALGHGGARALEEEELECREACVQALRGTEAHGFALEALEALEEDREFYQR